MLFDMAPTAQALEDLLDHERELILSGRVDDLARILRQKEQLLLRLKPDTSALPLSRVRRKAARNQAMLRAAARGLKAARKRIGDITAQSGPMRTYGANGAPQTLDHTTQKTGVNHRA